MTTTAQQAQQRIDELKAEIKAMELVMKDEQDKRRAEVKIERTFHVKPVPNDAWDRILDPAVTCYEIGATTLNAAQAREAGHHVDPDGRIRYLWNTLTERFIMRIGGGTVYAKDDETLQQVALFLQVCPDGGDITDIIEAGWQREQARRHAERQELERERAIYRKREEARKLAGWARARERQEMAETEAIRKSAERAAGGDL